MTDGLYKRTGWLRRLAERCFGIGLPNEGQGTELVRQADPGSVPLGLCDWESLPHDTVCVVDVSGSMGGTDCAPSRLEASKRATEAFCRRRAALSPGDRIAIVTFNNYGRVVLPLTEITRLDVILACLASLRVAGGTDLAEGLKAANSLFAQDVALNPALARYRRILMLTDGHGGNPLRWAAHLKNANVLIEIIGVGGDPSSAVDAKLLRKVATIDVDGFVHYWFFRDTDGLPTSLVFVAPRALIEAAILEAEYRGLPIIVPVGLGQGLAQMPHHCPMLYRWMCERLQRP